MTTIAPLTSYAEARRALLADAEDHGARLGSFAHPSTGPEGEPLATDTARFGAPVGEADTVVLLLSGVHGVEGHAGNGLQQNLVASGRLDDLPKGVAVVLVHAVNPYGMAWTRRVDAENVDVNRNFVDPADLPANALYDEVDPLLNPTANELDPTDVSFLGGLLEFRRAVNLDVHTGLGPLGRLTVFQTADDHEVAAELGQDWYPDHLYRTTRAEVGAIDHGLLGPGFDAWAAGRAPGAAPAETATFVLEFGTLDPLKGITAFRADNWLHHHGDPASATGQAISTLMREQFFVDDDGWRAQVAEQGEQSITATLDGVTA
jgi:hypothetical protein